MHDRCPPTNLLCSCWCHTVARALAKDKEESMTVHKLGLKRLTDTRAEFGEEPPPPSGGIQFHTTVLRSDTYGGYPDTNTHTWVITRKSWEEMGKPVGIKVTVTTGE
jgi:hypothetical protein